MTAFKDMVALTPRAEDQARTLARRLYLITLAWTFGAFWMFTVGGAAWTRFVKSMGMPDYGFGLLTALGYIGILFQVPAAWLIERWGHRKATFVVLATLSRLLWVVVAAVPWTMRWLLPNHPNWSWRVMLITVLLAYATANMTGPAWMSWMADVIPRRVRGRYFSWRNRIGQVVGIISTILVGWALDMAGPDSPQLLMLKITSAIIAIAGLAGSLDILCFRPIPDKSEKPPKPDTDPVKMLLEPLRNRNFRRYLAFNFTLNLAIGCIGQYIWPYLLTSLKKSNFQANLLIIALPLIVQMLAYGMWGKLMDRLGKKPVLIIAGAISIGGAVGWVLMAPQWTTLSIVGYGLILLTTAAWPGVDVANFNMILEMTSARESKGGTSYVAIFSLGVALGGIVSGLIGGAVAGHFENFHYPIAFLGIVLTYHSLIFLGSTVMRVVAIMCAIRLEEPRSANTRDAITYMTNYLYSNVRQVGMAPIRVVGQAYRWTYVLNQPIRKAITFGGLIGNDDPKP